ncbi:MAG: PEP-CTERM sorting domain-containing protein [Acidobacteria bacterium]|nr:PEP-CTERM sorting domain-containing protein [Acidobacteriota bacterium]
MNNIGISLKNILFVIAAIALFAAPSMADTVTFTGNTTGGPTYNRTETGAAPGTLSGIGTAVSYRVFQVNVSLTGNYSFESTATTPGYDPFLALYVGSFNPAMPLANFVIANDNRTPGNFTQSALGVFSPLQLLSGTNYFLVQSGFNNADFGAFTITANGPGVITVTPGGGGTAPIPEPATMILLGTGLAGLAARVRRRRKS